MLVLPSTPPLFQKLIIGPYELSKFSFIIGTPQEQTSYQRQDEIQTFSKDSYQKAGQNSNSHTGNHTPQQEHARTSMLALYCSDESQFPFQITKSYYNFNFFF